VPYKITKTIGGFKVVNVETGVVHAEHTSKAKALRQVRLLNAVDHGYRPSRRRKP